MLGRLLVKALGWDTGDTKGYILYSWRLGVSTEDLQEACLSGWLLPFLESYYEILHLNVQFFYFIFFVVWLHLFLNHVILMHLFSKWLLWHCCFVILNMMHTQECTVLTKILQIIGYMNDTIISCLHYLLLGGTAKLCTITGMVGTE